MKTFQTILLIFIFFELSIAQESIPDKQLMIWCTDVGETEEVTHYISAVGKVWELDVSTFVISTDQNIYNNEAISIGNADFTSNDWPGFNFKWREPGSEPIWGLGLYKVTNSKQTDKYFYLDARDSYFGIAQGQDIYFYLDNEISKYRHRNGQIINSGSLLYVSTIKSWPYSTVGLQNYWSNVLVFVNDGNDHPWLIWGKHPLDGVNFVVEEYKIYRAMTYYEEDEIVFSHIESVESDHFDYVDTEVEINQTSVLKVYYKVTATYNDNQDVLHETSPTNTI